MREVISRQVNQCAFCHEVIKPGEKAIQSRWMYHEDCHFKRFYRVKKSDWKIGILLER